MSPKEKAHQDFTRRGVDDNQYPPESKEHGEYEKAWEIEADIWLILNHAEQEGEHGHSKTI